MASSVSAFVNSCSVCGVLVLACCSYVRKSVANSLRFGVFLLAVVVPLVVVVFVSFIFVPFFPVVVPVNAFVSVALITDILTAL